MPKIQEWIYQLEVAKGPRYIRLGTFFLAVLVLWVAYNFFPGEYQNFGSPAAMDNAQLARNLAQGEGFTTDFVRPFGLHLIERHRSDRGSLLDGEHPDISNAPVYPLLLAGFMKAIPVRFDVGADAEQMSPEGRYQPDFMIAWLNQALFFVACGLVFFLGMRLFDSAVAWMATILFLGSDLLWGFSASGQSTMLQIVLLLAIVACLVGIDRAQQAEDAEATGASAAPGGPSARGKNRGSGATWGLGIACIGVMVALSLAGVTGFGLLMRYAFAWMLLPVLAFCLLAPKEARIAKLAMLSGYLVGLGGLTQYAFAWMLLPVALFLMASPAGLRRLWGPGVVVVALLVMAPWLARNYQWTGTLFGTATYAVCQDTMAFPDDTLERSLSPNLEEVTFNFITRKGVENFHALVRQGFPSLGGSLVAAFFFVSLLIPFRSPTLQRLKWFSGGSLLLLGIVQSLIRSEWSELAPSVNSENLLVLLVPLLLLFASALFYILLDQINFAFQGFRYLLIFAFVVVMCAPLLLRFAPPKSFPMTSPYNPSIIRSLADLEADELAMSDIPWAVAWYGDAQTISLSRNPQDAFYDVHDFRKSVSALYLTPVTLDAPLHSELLSGGKAEGQWGHFLYDIVIRRELPDGFPLLHSPYGLLSRGHVLLADKKLW